MQQALIQDQWCHLHIAYNGAYAIYQFITWACVGQAAIVQASVSFELPMQLLMYFLTLAWVTHNLSLREQSWQKFGHNFNSFRGH